MILSSLFSSFLPQPCKLILTLPDVAACPLPSFNNSMWKTQHERHFWRAHHICILPLVGAEFAALGILAINNGQQNHHDHKEHQRGNCRTEGSVNQSYTDIIWNFLWPKKQQSGKFTSAEVLHLANETRVGWLWALLTDRLSFTISKLESVIYFLCSPCLSKTVTAWKGPLIVILF